jgi:DNA-directed RNA polymerase subunit beta
VGLQLKYDVDECEERGMTYAAPLKVTIRLTIYDKDEDRQPTVRDIKEQEVFFGEIPLMTRQRHVHHQRHRARHRLQLHRSPGVFFERAPAQNYLGKIIPYRGSWVEFEYDPRTCCTSASTASASSTARCSCARWAEDRRGDPAGVLPRQTIEPEGNQAVLEGGSETLTGVKLVPTPSARSPAKYSSAGQSQDHAFHRARNAEAKITEVEVPPPRSRRRVLAADVIDMRPARCWPRPTRN